VAVASKRRGEDIYRDRVIVKFYQPSTQLTTGLSTLLNRMLKDKEARELIYILTNCSAGCDNPVSK
jgi:hypothetical protein